MAENKAPEKKAPLKMSLEKVFPFTPITESLFLKPQDLCRMVNSMMKEVFYDYLGCNININTPAQNVGGVKYASIDGLIPDVPMNAYFMNFFFADKGEKDPSDNRYYALNRLHPRSTNISGNRNTYSGLAASFDSFTEIRKNPHEYSITEDAKELLDDLMFRPRQFQQNLPKDFWAAHVFEYSQPMPDYYGMVNKPTIHVKVSGVDINKIINKLYADWSADLNCYVDDHGDPVDYQATFYVPPMGNSMDLIVKIDKMDKNTFRNFIDGMYTGQIMSGNYIPA